MAQQTISSQEFDVLIAGAGPGGIVSAMVLAEAGVNVGIVDKASFPRDKICGDAISGKAIEVLQSLNGAHYESLTAFTPKIGSWGVRFVAPSNQVLDVPFRSTIDKSEIAPGFISKRLDFDNFLLNRLKEAHGIKPIENYTVHGIDRHPDYIQVKPKNKDLPEIKTKILLGADGAQSVVAKQLMNFRVEPKHYCAGIRAYYRNVTHMHDDNFIELHFIKEFIPGYFWIFPLPNGQANIGVGMLSSAVSKKKVNLKESMLQIIKEHPMIAPRFKDAEIMDNIHGFGLPLGSKKRPISGERFMLIGDAASLIDPFTGEGIGNAMVSGKLAAEQAMRSLEANDFSKKFIYQYDRAVYKRLWGELRLSRTMQNLLKYPWMLNMVARKANSNTAIRDTISGMFEDMDLRQKLGKPSFYMKLFFNN